MVWNTTGMKYEAPGLGFISQCFLYRNLKASVFWGAWKHRWLERLQWNYIPLKYIVSWKAKYFAKSGNFVGNSFWKKWRGKSSGSGSTSSWNLFLVKYLSFHDRTFFKVTVCNNALMCKWPVRNDWRWTVNLDYFYEECGRQGSLVYLLLDHLNS